MRLRLWGMLCMLLLGLTAGCGVTTTGSGDVGAPQSTASATRVLGSPTPLNVPAGWQIYSGPHFTIAYPNGWTMTTSAVQTGLMGQGIILTDPTQPGTGQVSVVEEYGYSSSQLQAICQLPGTIVTLAGLRMKYTVGEGVHRNWQFVSSSGVSDTLDAQDGNQLQDVQKQHDRILATFRPDDATPACTW